MAFADHVPPRSRARAHAVVWRRWRIWAKRRDFRISFLVSAAMFAGSWFVNYYAILFATEKASNPATDIILSNVPVFDVDGLFVYGTLIFALIGAGILLSHPKRIPFALKTIALFWVIRSAFTSLTHIAPFDPRVADEFGPAISRLFFGADLFFSAHTGMPFLGALAFWREKGVRSTFLIGSAYFAVIVLLGHLHYSIDVFSAFFITYGIFHIAERLFPKDRELFYSDPPDAG